MSLLKQFSVLCLVLVTIHTARAQLGSIDFSSLTRTLNLDRIDEPVANFTDPPVIRNATTPFDLATITNSFFEVSKTNLTDGHPHEEVHFHEFWDASLPPPPPPPLHGDEHLVNVSFRVTASTGVPLTSTTDSTDTTTTSLSPTLPGTVTTTTTTTTTATSPITTLFPSTFPSTLPSSLPPTTVSTISATVPETTTTESSVTTLRLSSNVVTLTPPSTESVAVQSAGPLRPVATTSSINSPFGNGIDDSFISGSVFKQILHGTNMNSEELRLCNKTLLSAHLMPHSRRKVARILKSELDKQFAEFDYRWSVMISATSRNTMGKALHGVWLSSSINGLHYFLAATYKPLEGLRPAREEDMDRIENWAAVDTLSTRNMTGYHRYNKIATRLKMDLDTRLGRSGGNSWSVVIVKNRYLVKAKALELKDDFIQFTQLSGAEFLVWRGGPDIETDSRNARYVSMNDTPDDDDTSEHVFKRFTNANSFNFGRR